MDRERLTNEVTKVRIYRIRNIVKGFTKTGRVLGRMEDVKESRHLEKRGLKEKRGFMKESIQERRDLEKR